MIRKKLQAVNLQSLLKGKLWLQVMIALFLGIGVGVLLGPDLQLVSPERAAQWASWLALPGKIFLALIQMIVVPLVFSSIALGLGNSESMTQLKKTGLIVVVYFLFTTFMAVSIGLGLSLVLKPGLYLQSQEAFHQPQALNTKSPLSGSFVDNIVQLIPTNPLGAMMNLQMLQIVIFAIIVGIALLALAKVKSTPLLALMASIQEVCMQIVQWAMRLAPVAVFGLMIQATLQSGYQTLLGLAMYVLVALGGMMLLLVMHLVVTKLVAGLNPLEFLKKIFSLQLLAFSTSSSAAVLPFSIKTSEEQFGLKPSIPQFVIPLGSTINMDGTALYQGVATIFLAQVYAVELSLPILILIVVTSIGASIGTPSTPGVGIIVLATILSAANIPTEGIALILGVDRILDMTRTALNVTGDQVACLVVNRFTKSSSA